MWSWSSDMCTMGIAIFNGKSRGGKGCSFLIILELSHHIVCVWDNDHHTCASCGEWSMALWSLQRENNLILTRSGERERERERKKLLLMFSIIVIWGIYRNIIHKQGDPLKCSLNSLLCNYNVTFGRLIFIRTLIFWPLSLHH